MSSDIVISPAPVEADGHLAVQGLSKKLGTLKVDTTLQAPTDFKGLHESPSPSPRSPTNAFVFDEKDLYDPSKACKKTTLNPNVKGAETAEVFCLQYSTDSRFLAAGCGDGSVRIFNQVGKLSYTFNLNVPNKMPVTCLRFRPSSQTSQTSNIVLVGNADGTVSHWHMTSQKQIFTIEEQENQIYTVDYRPDAEQFATAGRDCKVRIYEENTKTLLRTLSGGHTRKNMGHSNRIYSVKFKPDDPNILLSGGWDNTVQIWDIRAGQSVRSIYGPHICGEALDVSKDQILTASWRPDDALQVWDFASGKLVHTLPWSYGGKTVDPSKKQPEMLYAGGFSPDGDLIAAGGCGTNEGKLYDAKTFQLLDRVHLGEKGVYSLAFAPSGRKLAFGGGTSDVSIWDIKP